VAGKFLWHVSQRGLGRCLVKERQSSLPTLSQHELYVAAFLRRFGSVRENKTIGKKIRAVKPILQFPGGEVELKYNVGTRSNGIDAAKWPHDLMSEVVI